MDIQSPAGVLAADGFPLFGVGALFYIVNIALIGYYQSIEKVRKSTLFMLLRGFIFLIPIFFLLPAMAGTHGLWLVMPATELLTTIVIYLAWRMSRRRVIAA